MRTVNIDDWQELENLPHGTVVRAGDKRIVMNREDPYVTEPFFDCEDDGWLRPNNVWSYFGVQNVVVDD